MMVYHGLLLRDTASENQLLTNFPQSHLSSHAVPSSVR